MTQAADFALVGVYSPDIIPLMANAFKVFATNEGDHIALTGCVDSGNHFFHLRSFCAAFHDQRVSLDCDKACMSV